MRSRRDEPFRSMHPRGRQTEECERDADIAPNPDGHASDITRAGNLSVLSYRLSVVSCRLSVVGCRLSVVGYRLSVIGPDPPARRLRLVTRNRQPELLT